MLIFRLPLSHINIWLSRFDITLVRINYCDTAILLSLIDLSMLVQLVIILVIRRLLTALVSQGRRVFINKKPKTTVVS